MGDSVESLAEVKVDNMHDSPFVYPSITSLYSTFKISLFPQLPKFFFKYFFLLSLFPP